jgi:hypothetical protein
LSRESFLLFYSYFFYPMPTVMLHSSTFLTVLLAWHRFNATVHPIEYFIAWKLVNPTWYIFSSLRGSVIPFPAVFFKSYHPGGIRSHDP